VADGRSASPTSSTTLDRRGERELVISRTFKAPPRIVFDAWTKPEFVRRWWAPQSCTQMLECTADVRVGGGYRYRLRNPDGSEVGFFGTYSEITPPTRLVYTQIFEPFPDSPVVVTVTFEEHEGRTRLVSHEVYPSKEALDAALASGMESGLRITLDQLDALVASLA
jgi:uncharacterized protein YndB with AHSA1/START domain